jgi:hypothetical protein
MGQKIFGPLEKKTLQIADFVFYYIKNGFGTNSLHKVPIYLEYHIVYPLVRIGTHPSPGIKGGTHSPAG